MNVHKLFIEHSSIPDKSIGHKILPLGIIRDNQFAQSTQIYGGISQVDSARGVHSMEPQSAKSIQFFPY